VCTNRSRHLNGRRQTSNLRREICCRLCMHALRHAHTPSDRALFSHIQQAEAEQQDVEDLLHHCTSLAASCPTLQAAESASTIPLKCQAMHVPKPLHLRARAGRQDALQTLVQVHHRPTDGAVPGGRQLPQRRRYAAPVVRPLAAVAADKRPALPAFAAGIVMLQACDRGFCQDVCLADTGMTSGGSAWPSGARTTMVRAQIAPLWT